MRKIKQYIKYKGRLIVGKVASVDEKIMQSASSKLKFIPLDIKNSATIESVAETDRSNFIKYTKSGRINTATKIYKAGRRIVIKAARPIRKRL